MGTDENINKLQRKRSTLRSKVTRITGKINNADGIDKAFDVEQLEETLKDLKLVNEDIHDLLNDEDYERDTVDCEKYFDTAKLAIFNTKRKYCKVKNSCLYCAKPHHYLMCDQAKNNVNQKSSGIETNSLSNSCSKNNVFLMTLVVNVCANNKIIKVRALIDSGSQYSYISIHVIQKLGLKSNNKIKMQRQLFGGRETQDQSHDVYELLICPLDESFSLRIELLSEKKI
ncbi:integrase catalytic domain-containing protein [Nephila pilipes]|uniref:Integrase catalytic domain-containing protein n=1 Tax=Nephila pilipes TaxID=299642 RepID=A0A8X6MSA4_NEPPI|nr:integrase catalytic domain-containing protein [Nephila pilipes]